MILESEIFAVILPGKIVYPPYHRHHHGNKSRLLRLPTKENIFSPIDKAGVSEVAPIQSKIAVPREQLRWRSDIVRIVQQTNA